MFNRPIYQPNFKMKKKKKRASENEKSWVNQIHCFFSIHTFSRKLGSKTLGLNVLELHFVMLANHDQNI